MSKKKAADADAPKSRARKIEIVAGNDVPVLYANNAQIELSTFDVRLKLGQIQGGDDASIQIKELAYVFMSHSHFRAFAKAVQTTLTKLDSTPELEARPEKGVPH